MTTIERLMELIQCEVPEEDHVCAKCGEELSVPDLGRVITRTALVTKWHAAKEGT